MLLLKKFLPDKSLEEIWMMPADVTISLLASAGRLRSAAAAALAPAAAPQGETAIHGLGDLKQFQASARGGGGIITEAAEGAAALAQLDRFMLRGGASGNGSSKE